MEGRGALRRAALGALERDVMTQVLAATTALFRDRDLFIHDGTKLRRFRISAPVQAAFVVFLFGLVAWASYATGRLILATRIVATAAATETRTRLLEQRQALIEAALTGQKIDPAMIQAAVDQRPSRQRRPARPRRAAAARAGRARRAGARRPLSGLRRRAEEARDQAGRRRPARAASAVRSRRSATPLSRRCSTAGRSSTSFRTTSSPFRPTSRSAPR